MITRRQLIMATAGVDAGILAPAILKAKRTLAALSALKFTEPLPTLFATSPLNTLTVESKSYSFHKSLGEGLTFGYAGASYLL